MMRQIYVVLLENYGYDAVVLGVANDPITAEEIKADQLALASSLDIERESFEVSIHPAAIEI